MPHAWHTVYCTFAVVSATMTRTFTTACYRVIRPTVTRTRTGKSFVMYRFGMAQCRFRSCGNFLQHVHLAPWEMKLCARPPSPERHPRNIQPDHESSPLFHTVNNFVSTSFVAHLLQHLYCSWNHNDWNIRNHLLWHSLIRNIQNRNMRMYQDEYFCRCFATMPSTLRQSSATCMFHPQKGETYCGCSAAYRTTDLCLS